MLISLQTEWSESHCSVYRVAYFQISSLFLFLINQFPLAGTRKTRTVLHKSFCSHSQKWNFQQIINIAPNRKITSYFARAWTVYFWTKSSISILLTIMKIPHIWIVKVGDRSVQRHLRLLFSVSPMNLCVGAESIVAAPVLNISDLLYRKSITFWVFHKIMKKI